MDMYEFGKACKPLNKQYKEIFGYIPHQMEFPCTREEYLLALSLSVKERKEIYYFLPESIEYK